MSIQTFYKQNCRLLPFKWILAIVLLLNAVVFYWRSVTAGYVNTEVRTLQAVNELASPIMLLGEVSLPAEAKNIPSEAPKSSIEYDTVDSAEASETSETSETRDSVPESNTAVAEIKCVQLGPFNEHKAASDITGKSTGLGISTVIGGAEEDILKGYWVYIPPLQSMALLAKTRSQLQAKGIDSFAFQDGRLKNGISLGFFTSDENARRRLNELSVKGFAANIEPVINKVPRYWVTMQQVAADSLSRQFWSDIADHSSNVEASITKCAVGES